MIVMPAEPQTSLGPDIDGKGAGAKLVLGLDWNGALMTPQEFDAINDYDDTYRYELIHGVVIVNPLPLESEVDPTEELGYLLRYYQEHHPKGKALNKTLAERYVRTVDSRRRADRIIWAGLGRTPLPKKDLPTIVIEFVSKSRRDWRPDYVEKKREYMEIGIKEYWIIDRFRRIMTVVVNQLSGPQEHIVQESESYQSQWLPGFELPLGRLLIMADAWKEGE